MGFLTDLASLPGKLMAAKDRVVDSANGAKAIATGFGITFKHYAEQQTKIKPTGTVQYPEEIREQFPRTRWRHFLTRYDQRPGEVYRLQPLRRRLPGPLHLRRGGREYG